MLTTSQSPLNECYKSVYSQATVRCRGPFPITSPSDVIGISLIYVVHQLTTANKVMSRYLLCALLLAITQPSLAMEDTSLVVVTEELPPYNFTNAQGQIDGINTRIVRQILQSAELDYKMISYPWVRAYAIAQQTENVLIFTIAKNKQRAPYFHWYCPLMPSSGLYLVRLKTNSHLEVNRLEDALQYRIGVVKDGNLYNYLTNHGFSDNIQLDVTAKDATNIKKLFKGRVDFVGLNPETLPHYLAQFGKEMKDVDMEFKLYQEGPRCMALNINSSPIIIDKLNRAFSKIRP